MSIADRMFKGGMYMTRSLITLGAALALATATSAAATPFTVTYTGTVALDYYGNFANGQSATGDSYSETYTVDPATPGANNFNLPGLTLTAGSDGSNPVIADSITVGGVVYSDNYAPHVGSDEQLINYNGYENFAYDDNESYDISGYWYSRNQINDLTAGEWLAPAVYGGSGYFTLPADGNSVGYLETDNVNIAGYGYLILAPTAVSFNGAGPGPVPEPATWAMMLAGLGLTGFAMRRRSRSGHAYR